MEAILGLYSIIKYTVIYITTYGCLLPYTLYIHIWNIKTLRLEHWWYKGKQHFDVLFAAPKDCFAKVFHS